MKNKLLNLATIIILGGFGGVLACQIFLPWLAGFSLFSTISWIRQAAEGTTVINRTERVVVTENEGLEQAIDKTSLIVVEIISEKTDKIVGKTKIPLAKPEILKTGTGIIVSSDGLIITAENLVPELAQKILVISGGKQSQAEIKKRDKNSGLILLKISESNLPVLAFSDENLKLGQSLFLIGLKNKSDKFVDLGIVKQIQPSLAVGFTSSDINGSPIFNIKSEVVGMNLVDNNGQQKIVLSTVLKELLK